MLLKFDRPIVMIVKFFREFRDFMNYWEVKLRLSALWNENR